MKVGVLALQGDFAAHARALAGADAEALLVRASADFAGIDALVLPGGESTAILHALARDGLERPLAAFIASGRAVLGTCAGAILLAREVHGSRSGLRIPDPSPRRMDAGPFGPSSGEFGPRSRRESGAYLVDTASSRNDEIGPKARARRRERGSETASSQRSFGALDIAIARNAYGTQVDSFVARVETEADSEFEGLECVLIRAPRIVRVGPDVTVHARVRGEPALVSAGPVWAATFHPELTDDARVQRAWLRSAAARA